MLDEVEPLNWLQSSFLMGFRLESELGKGGFSTVYRVYEKRRSLIENEIAYFNRLSHPGIINYKTCTSECNRFFTLLELMPASQELANFRACLDYKTFRYIAAQIVSVLDYLFEQKMLHRDLKPNNILINGMHRIKLIDFGFTRSLKSGQKAYTALGTVSYISPEIMDGRGYDFSSEVWSLGVMLHVLVFKTYPFGLDTSCGIQKAFQFIHVHPFDTKKAKLELEGNQILYHCGLKVINLIKHCLRRKPFSRPSMTALKPHEFFQAYSYEEIKRIPFRYKKSVRVPAIAWNKFYL